MGIFKTLSEMPSDTEIRREVREIREKHALLRDVPVAHPGRERLRDLEQEARNRTVDKALAEVPPMVAQLGLPPGNEDRLANEVMDARRNVQRTLQRAERFPAVNGRKSIASMLGKLTMGGETIAIFMAEVAAGTLTTPIVTKDGVIVDVAPTLDQRVDASKWIADRQWGRAVEKIEAGPIGSTEETDLAQLSNEELSQVTAAVAVLGRKKDGA